MQVLRSRNNANIWESLMSILIISPITKENINEASLLVISKGKFRIFKSGVDGDVGNGGKFCCSWCSSDCCCCCWCCCCVELCISPGGKFDTLLFRCRMEFPPLLLLVWIIPLLVAFNACDSIWFCRPLFWWESELYAPKDGSDDIVDALRYVLKTKVKYKK